MLRYASKSIVLTEIGGADPHRRQGASKSIVLTEIGGRRQ